MSFRILGIDIDERFLTHRQRSTSMAGIATAMLSLLLFAWHFYVGHEIRWELFALGLFFVVVKLSLMVWYRLTD